MKRLMATIVAATFATNVLAQVPTPNPRRNTTECYTTAEVEKMAFQEAAKAGVGAPHFSYLTRDQVIELLNLNESTVPELLGGAMLIFWDHNKIVLMGAIDTDGHNCSGYPLSRFTYDQMEAMRNNISRTSI